MKLFQYSICLIITFAAFTATQLEVFGLVESSRIDSNPPQIRFKVPDYRTSSLPTYSVELTSNVNLENISSSVSTLTPTEDGKIWIPGDHVKVQPPVFSIFKGVPKILNISFSLPNQTTTYLGTLTIASNDGYTKKIPMEISIYESSTLYSLVAVTIGVIIAFIIKYTKLRMGTRSIVMESIDRSRIAYSKAISEGRADDRLMSGLDEIARGIQYINRGDFEYAKKIVDGSVDIFNSAKQSKRGIQIKKAVFDTLVDQARTKKVFISTLKHPNMVIFFLTSLALGVIIIQTWLQVYSQIQPLNQSPLGLALAFLLGYGSQSLLGETLDLFKV